MANTVIRPEEPQNAGYVSLLIVGNLLPADLRQKDDLLHVHSDHEQHSRAQG